MENSNNTWNDIIQEAIASSTYTKHITDCHWQYYDKYNNLSVEALKSPHSDDICYTFYENKYDTNHCLIQVMSIGNNPFHLTRYFYSENKLVRKEEYTPETDMLRSYIVIECDGYKFSLNKINYYYYDMNGSMQQEIVTLPTGDISCFIEYDGETGEEKVINPFKTVYQWSIEWINDSTIEIDLRQGYYGISVLEDVVETIHAYYPFCKSIYLTCYISCTHTDHTFEEINALYNKYETEYGIHVVDF